MGDPLPPPGSQVQNQRPTLRCPGCAFMVPLPAETCPRCGTNLRTGEGPLAEDHPSNGPKIVIGVLALLIIIGLAVFLFGDFKAEPDPVQKAAPAKSADDVGEAVNIFHDLPDQNLGVKPGLIMDRSKDTADKWEEKRREMDETFLSTE